MAQPLKKKEHTDRPDQDRRRAQGRAGSSLKKEQFNLRFQKATGSSRSRRAS